MGMQRYGLVIYLQKKLKKKLPSHQTFFLPASSLKTARSKIILLAPHFMAYLDHFFNQFQGSSKARVTRGAMPLVAMPLVATY
jgi:hypothetical protein